MFSQSRLVVKMSRVYEFAFFHLRGATKAVEYASAPTIVSFDEYYDAFIHSDAKFRQDYDGRCSITAAT